MDPGQAGLVPGEDGLPRCWWAAGDPAYLPYHDLEWGRPEADDSLLFENLCLEGFQSGLSWLTILRKRDGFRRAFSGFDPESVARFNARSVERLLRDPGIVRHRSKIEATIHNARRCLDLRREVGSLGAYAWSFEPQPAARRRVLDRAALQAMSTSAESEAMSADLKRRGWRFVGPTTVYAFMQAMGLVNDHLDGCHVQDDVDRERSAFARPVPAR